MGGMVRTAVVLMLLTLLIIPAAAEDIPLPRIAVWGAYAAGFDNVLYRMGLPWERFYVPEAENPEAWQRYDIVLINAYPGLSPRGWDNLGTFVRGGGKVFLEYFHGEKLQLLGVPVEMLKEAQELEITGEHPMLSRLPVGTKITGYGMRSFALKDTSALNAVVLGKLVPDGRSALVVCGLGEGELIFAGNSPSMVNCLRGPASEPLIAGAIEYMAAGRLTPLFAFDAGADDLPLPDEEVTDPVYGDPAGKLPDGVQDLELCGGPYNIYGTLAKNPGAEGASRLYFDARGVNDWYALEARTGRLAVVQGLAGRENVLYEHALPEDADTVEFVLCRRPGVMRVLLDNQPVIFGEMPTHINGLGGVAGEGSVVFAETGTQPISAVRFADDFTRDTNEPDAWEPVDGTWRNSGPEKDIKSVNAFSYAADCDPATGGRALAGFWFWDNYMLGAAVRTVNAESRAGLLFYALDEQNYYVFEAAGGGDAAQGLKLWRMKNGEREELAHASGLFTPEQWFRMAVAPREDGIVAFVEGWPVISWQGETAGMGQAGLYGAGKTFFDDVLVEPYTSAGPSIPRGEGTARPVLPHTLGPLDRCTWGNPASMWRVSHEVPHTATHVGYFPADVKFSLKPGALDANAAGTLFLSAPNALEPTAELRLSVSGGKSTATLSVEGNTVGQFPFDPEVGVSLARHGNIIQAYTGIFPTLQAPTTQRAQQVGFSWNGPPLDPHNLQVESPNTRDYCFATAPTDWWFSRGEWEIVPRWACDPRWAWLSGMSEKDAVTWNKRRYAGDMVMEYYVGIKMDAPGGKEEQRTRDLNGVIHGDGNDPRSGYSLAVGGAGAPVTRLYRAGEVIAEIPAVHIPNGIHNRWFNIVLGRTGRTVFVEFEGRRVFAWDDPAPITDGYSGLWTHNSGICVPRVRLWYEREMQSVPGAGG